jgi:hypothetical protein
MSRKPSVSQPKLQALAAKVVDQKLAALEAHLTSGYHEFLYPDTSEDEPDEAFQELLEAVIVEAERALKADGEEPGEKFEHCSYADAGFLLGLAYGRRLGGAR